VAVAAAPPLKPARAARPASTSRRKFFNDAFSIPAWLAFASGVLGSLGLLQRFMYPNVLYEPPTTFKAGFPGDYAVGEFSQKFKELYRVWIIRSATDFYAIYAKCTHLGCTPNWMQTEDKIKCPCHGSGFYRTGINFEGPAPRPLERVKVALADDGQLLVDTSIHYVFEKGEWELPNASVKT
jgi:cytochrome b6-f complex iron-sulfur subunit